MGRPPVPLLERLTDRIVCLPDGCWLWTGYVDVDGYGLVGAGGRNCRTLRAHRAVYELAIGPIPPWMVIDHLCGVRNCVNPVHLEVVTVAENARRSNATRSLRPHCVWGHAFDRENTYITARGERQCRICKARRERERYRRRRAELVA